MATFSQYSCVMYSDTHRKKMIFKTAQFLKLAIHGIHAAPHIFHSISSLFSNEKKVSVPFDKLNLVVLCNDASNTQKYDFGQW